MFENLLLSLYKNWHITHKKKSDYSFNEKKYVEKIAKNHYQRRIKNPVKYLS